MHGQNKLSYSFILMFILVFMLLIFPIAHIMQNNE